MQKIRKYLHQHPEVSGEEKKTSDYIAKQLKEIGVSKVNRGFSQNSIVAEIDYDQSGKTILFRCELDALPIQEVNDFEYKSEVDGVSHKCGHDGHMTMMLGLAKRLVEAEFHGKILLLFQSSEEDGEGAKSIIESGKLKEFDIHFVFSLHNIPGIPKNDIICKPGNFTPVVESVDIHLNGKTSHAGMPDKGINPAETIAEIIQFFKSLHHPKPDDKKYFLSVPIEIKLGQPAYGTAAGKGMISYTIRAWEPDFFDKQKKKIIKELKSIVSKTKGLKYELEWKQAFDANMNDEKAYELIKEAAKQNDLNFTEKKEPFGWGEDFGTFTQEYRGAMFGLGAGEDTPELHNPDYDFPDEIHETGVNMFFTLAKNLMK